MEKKKNRTKIIALIIAGGSGVRMGSKTPKQFLHIGNKPVIAYTLEAFEKHPDIETIAVVCIDGWQKKLREYAENYNISKLKYIVTGGENGQSSIRNGLFELENYYRYDDIVLIHDAIRPLVSNEIISDCIEVVKRNGNAITVIPCAEAMLQTSDGLSSVASYPRDNLKRTQTPQGFYLGDICNLHRDALKNGITNSVASCTLMIEMGKEVYFSKGSEKNVKLTTLEDLTIFKALLDTKDSDLLKDEENEFVQ